VDRSTSLAHLLKACKPVKVPTPEAWPPAWIYKRDGRLVAFEADKVSRSLFAASEALGGPDPFKARELTDGVLHFLASEVNGRATTTAELSEIIIKVVRELGHPDLARIFADGAGWRADSSRHRAEDHARPRQAFEDEASTLAARNTTELKDVDIGDEVLGEPGFRDTLGRDLAGLQADGFLVLAGLERPGRLASIVCPPPAQAAARLEEALERSRSVVGPLLIVEAPEHLAPTLHHCQQDARAFLRDMETWLRANHRYCLLNLNCTQPPAWAVQVALGPLFDESNDENQFPLRFSNGIVSDWYEQWEQGCRIRVYWHLSENDLQECARDRLERVIEVALAGRPLCFVLDRPGQPISLGEGTTHSRPAVLLTVGLNLPRLAEHLTPGVSLDAYLGKLMTLVRLARSAGLRQRELLRLRASQHLELRQGFLLERARLVLTPIGLEAAACKLSENDHAGRTRSEIARALVQCLHDTAERECERDGLEAVVDSPSLFDLSAQQESVDMSDLSSVSVAGLTCWDAKAPPLLQLREAGSWHKMTGAGTAALLLSGQHLSPAVVRERICDAWWRSEVRRMRIVRHR
jgi:hypothetical protein